MDIKGNVSAVKSQRLLIAADEPRARSAARCRRRSSLSLGTPATFGAFTPGVARDYTAHHVGQRGVHGG